MIVLKLLYTYSLTTHTQTVVHNLNREEIIKNLAKSYFDLLSNLNWENDLLIKGIKEGLNKFLSNAFLKSKTRKKYFNCDYFSQNALEQVKNNNFDRLIFEHMIPKNEYIQKPCEAKAKDGNLKLEFIENLLLQYWFIATITKDEDKLLDRNKMPEKWDNKDIFYRYTKANIVLVKNTLI